MTQPPTTPEAIVTDAMIEAGVRAWENDPEAGWADDSDMVVAIYTAMLAASPNPEASEIMPVAWRWRFVYPNRVGRWTLRSTPIEPYGATTGLASVEVEPLYTREALSLKGEREGG
jgi:hypothetical protein